MNPLITQQTLNNVSNIGSMYKNFKNSLDPMAYLQNLSMQNPIVAQAIQICNGRNPQEVFYEMCQSQGVDPNVILRQLNQ